MTENQDLPTAPVPNIGRTAVSGIDGEPLPAREPSTLAGHPAYREQREGDAPDGYLDPDEKVAGQDADEDEVLRGEALDAALEDAGLSKSGTADEKRARLAESRGA